MTGADLNNTSDTTEASETKEMTWANTFAGISLSVSENTAIKHVQKLFDEWAGTDEDKIRQLLELTDKNGNTFLMKVVGAGMVNLATMLLGDENKNVQNNSGWTLLYQAVYNDNEKMVQMLLEKGVDVNIPNNDGWTPLYQAVFKRNKRIAKMLLERDDVNVNAQNKKKWTALHLAVFNGDTDLVEELLNKEGIDISLLNDEGQTPFLMAALNKDTRIVEKLAKKMDVDVLQAEINRIGENSEIQKFLKQILGKKYKEPQRQPETVEDDNTAEKKAAETEKKQEQKPTEEVQAEPVAEEVKPIVKKEVAKPVEKVTPVVEKNEPVEKKNVIPPVAVEKARPVVETAAEEIVQAEPSKKTERKQPKVGLFGKIKRRLMKHWFFSWRKIDWNASDKEIAAQVKRLIEAGADVNARNDDDDTMLILAATEGKLETVKVLLENHADPNLKGHNDDTAMHWAAGNGYDDIVDELRKKGARLNEINAEGRTPLIDAIKAGKVAVASKIANMEGVDLNLQDSEGRSALIVAINVGRVSLASKISDTGIDLNLQDSEGNSALIAAIKAKQSIIAKKLANKPGVDLNLQDNDCNSALMLAAQEGDEDLMLFLVERGANVNAKNKKEKTVLQQLEVAGKHDLCEKIKRAVRYRGNKVLPLEAQYETSAVVPEKNNPGMIRLNGNDGR